MIVVAVGVPILTTRLLTAVGGGVGSLAVVRVSAR